MPYREPKTIKPIKMFGWFISVWFFRSVLKCKINRNDAVQLFKFLVKHELLQDVASEAESHIIVGISWSRR